MKTKAYIYITVMTTVILCASISISLSQSVPYLINYQGKIMDKISSEPLDGVNIDMTFSFYDSDTEGILYLSVFQKDVLVKGGMYNVLIGSGTIISGTENSLAAVFQKHSEVWLGVKVGIDNEMTPRSLISSVPYALSIDSNFLGTFIAKEDWDNDGYLKDGDPKDCNDGNPNIYPHALEICDGLDNQCPENDGYGEIDEGCCGNKTCDSPWENEATCPEDCGCGLVIREVYYNNTGPDDGYEWVRLYNSSAFDIDLSEYSLGHGGPDYTWGVYQLSGTILARECFVVGGPNSDETNGDPVFDQVLNFDPDLQNSGSTADGIALFHASPSSITPSMIPIDAVIYGESNSNNLLDSVGNVPNPHVSDGLPGQSILRLSDNSWMINPTPTPGNCPD